MKVTEDNEELVQFSNEKMREVKNAEAAAERAEAKTSVLKYRQERLKELE